MIKLIFYGILFYLLYKLVFDFIIPVSKATSQIKKNIRDAQAQQQQYYQQQDQQTPKQTEGTAPRPDAEYIDFEEVK